MKIGVPFLLAGLSLWVNACGEDVMIAANEGQLTSEEGDASTGDAAADGANGTLVACGLIPCEGDDACWKTSNSTWGVCVGRCTTDADCPGTICMKGSPQGACAPACTPWTGQECPYDGQCFIMTTTGMETDETVAISVCGAEGEQQKGESCGGGSGFCAPLLTCVNSACYPLCRFGSGDCTSGSCYHLDPAPVFDGVEYGVCAN